jgi:hypothetical protein
MRAGESVYHPARHRADPLVLAIASGRKGGVGEAVRELNRCVAKAQAGIRGGGASAGNVREVLSGLLAYGFPPPIILRMFQRFPALLCGNWGRLHGTADAPGRLLQLERHGFSRSQVVRLCSSLPSVFSYSWERTSGILAGLERYGFDREQVTRICTLFPAILSYSWAHTHGGKDCPGTLLRLERYGFDREQVIGLCTRYPPVLGRSWERTHGTPAAPGILLRLEGCGIPRREVIDLCVRAPVVFGCRWERTEQQLRLSMRIGLTMLAPQILLFAPEKTEWRWAYLTETKALSASQARWELFLNRDEFGGRHGTDYEPGRP